MSQKVVCTACKTPKTADNFSKTQFKKSGKCKACMNGSDLSFQPHIEQVLANNHNVSSQVIVYPTVQLPQHLWDQVIRDNSTLKQENEQLKNKLGLANERILYLTKWENAKDRIDKLVAENEQLQKENEKLRQTIKELEGQVSVLMKSRLNENKLAIRRLIDDAKAKGISSFSDRVQAMMKKIKSSVNLAAHCPVYYNPARIQEAIDEEKRYQLRTVLQETFDNTYRKSELNDMDDDFSEFDDS